MPIKQGDRVRVSEEHPERAGQYGIVGCPLSAGWRWVQFSEGVHTSLVPIEVKYLRHVIKGEDGKWNFVWSNRTEQDFIWPAIVERKQPGPPPRPEIGQIWLSFLDKTPVQIINTYVPKGATHTYVQWRELNHNTLVPPTLLVQSTRHSARIREFWKMFRLTSAYDRYTVLEPIVPGHVWKSNSGTEVVITSATTLAIGYNYIKDTSVWVKTDEKHFRALFNFAYVPKKEPYKEFAKKIYEEWHAAPLPSSEIRDRANIISWINTLVNLCHGASIDRGWYKDPKTGKTLQARNVGELICLIHSELSEALEGFRKSLMDKHLPDRKAVEVELADALIRIFDLAGYLREKDIQINLGVGFAGKLDYNKTRADHSPEARAKADGKKF